MTYRTEFPDFDYELPVIPGFADESWHNDVCPVLRNGEMYLWCDYADASLREFTGGKLFHLVDNGVTVCASDELATILFALRKVG